MSQIEEWDVIDPSSFTNATEVSPKEVLVKWWKGQQAVSLPEPFEAQISWGSLYLYEVTPSTQDDLFNIKAENWYLRFECYDALLFFTVDENSFIHVIGAVSVQQLKKVTKEASGAFNILPYLRKTTVLPSDWVNRENDYIQCGHGQKIHDGTLSLQQLEDQSKMPTEETMHQLLFIYVEPFEEFIIEFDKLIQIHEIRHTHRSEAYWQDVKKLVKDRYLSKFDFSKIEHRILDYCLRRHLFYYILAIERDVVWMRLAEVASHLLRCIIQLCWPHEQLVYEFLQNAGLNSWCVPLKGYPGVNIMLTGWSQSWKTMIPSEKKQMMALLASPTQQQNETKKKVLLKASDSNSPTFPTFITDNTLRACKDKYEASIRQALEQEPLLACLDNADTEFWLDPIPTLSKRLKDFSKTVATKSHTEFGKVWIFLPTDQLMEQSMEDDSMEQFLYDYFPTKMFFVFRDIANGDKDIHERLTKSVKDYVLTTKEFSTKQTDAILKDFRQYSLAGKYRVCVFNSLVVKSLATLRMILFHGDAIRFLPRSENLAPEFYVDQTSIAVPFECLLQPDLDQLKCAHQWNNFEDPKKPELGRALSNTSNGSPTNGDSLFQFDKLAPVINQMLVDFSRSYPKCDAPRFVWTRPKEFFDANPTEEGLGIMREVIGQSGVSAYLVCYKDMGFLLGSKWRHYLYTMKEQELRKKYGNQLTRMFEAFDPKDGLVQKKACVDAAFRFIEKYCIANPGVDRGKRESLQTFIELPKNTITNAPSPFVASLNKKKPKGTKELKKMESDRVRKEHRNLREYANTHIEEYCTFLMGQPFVKLNNEIKYGTKGSFKLTTKGDYKQHWIDWEHGIHSKGSYALTLYQLYSEANDGHFPAEMCKQQKKKKISEQPPQKPKGNKPKPFEKDVWQEIAEQTIKTVDIYVRLNEFFQAKVDHLDGKKYIRDQNGPNKAETDQDRDEKISKRIAKSKEDMKTLYARTCSLTDTLAAEYIRETRGIDCISEYVLEASPFLRFCPALEYFHKMDMDTGIKKPYDTLPAIIYFAVNKEHEIVGCQRIYLDAKTKKKVAFENQLIDPPKKSMGALKDCNAFACIQYGRLDKLSCIYLAEGPETATSVAAASPYMRVYTAFGIGNFWRFDFDLVIKKQDSPTGISCPVLCLCLDRDPPAKRKVNRETINNAVKELSDIGWTIVEFMPEECDEVQKGEKVDFNDVILKHGIDRLRDLLQVPESARITWFDEDARTRDDDNNEWPAESAGWAKASTILSDEESVSLLRKKIESSSE